MLEHQVQLKQNQRDTLAAAMERFIKQGGAIHRVPSNVFGNADLSLSDGRRPEGFSKGIAKQVREKNNK